ncbi:hypothetical protein UPYG_G00053880 [Umbra pygmaea]|uniref:CARD domain-containing protein n=1 Tax=Umbra pygmaea TaxID=75934 RepID=A0ABD0XMZ0_UMBPY
MDSAEFVDKHRAVLTQRVTTVMPIADYLLQMGVIHDEAYSNISAAQTSPAKMRELYMALQTGGVKAKSAFYTSLLKNARFLVEELNTTIVASCESNTSSLPGGAASTETENTKQSAGNKIKVPLLLVSTLDELDSKQLERFQGYLNYGVTGFDPIPNSQLENATTMKTVDLLVTRWCDDGALINTQNILKLMGLNKLANALVKK